MRLAKKWLLLLTCCLCNFSCASPIQEQKIDSLALSQLTLAPGIPQNADLVKETQKHWLRKANQERGELAELPPEQTRLYCPLGLSGKPSALNKLAYDLKMKNVAKTMNTNPII